MAESHPFIQIETVLSQIEDHLLQTIANIHPSGLHILKITLEKIDLLLPRD